MDLDRVRGNKLGEGFDANVRTSADVEPGEAYREANRIGGHAKVFVVLQPGLVLRTDIHGIEGVGIASGHGTWYAADWEVSPVSRKLRELNCVQIDLPFSLYRINYCAG